jgi:hypothetical protein
MVRFIVGLAMGLNCFLNAQAAVVATYNFNSNLSASFSQQGVGFTAGAFTPSSLPGTVIRTPLVGVGTTGAGVFGSTGNRNSFVNQATVTLSRAAGVTVRSLNFDIRRSAIPLLNSNGTLRISNNLNSKVFDIVVTNSAFPNNQTITFDTALASSSITFTFSTKAAPSNAIIKPSFTPIIDNVNVDGVVPEPASMAVFVGLGIAGMAARRRFRQEV